MRSMLFSARISGSGAAFLVSAIIIRRHAALVFVAPINRGVLNINKRFMSSRVVQGATSHATTPTLSSTVDSRLAGRIYELVGREFDISKPAVLSKVLFDEVQVFDPHGNSDGSKARKAKSTSVPSLKDALHFELDPTKRELLTLVLDWLDAKALVRRGGFQASGEKVGDRPDWCSRIIPDHDELKADPDAPSVLLVDGHNIIFRSFHALPHLTTPDGIPVGAVVGFCNAMNKLVLQLWANGSEPRRRVVVALDTGKDNFRHIAYPTYKAGRSEVPEELRPQFSLVRQVCEAYGFEIAEAPGYEADDVIATLALQAVTSGATNVTIVSSDKDLAQLVTRRVSMFNCYTGERLGPDEVLAKHLAPPGRLADLLAIAGDKADGIRGADGYGPVNAAKVLAKHATLEGAIEEICEALSKKKKDQDVINEVRSEILLARSVVELRTDVLHPLSTALARDGQKTGPQSVGKGGYFELGAGEGAGPLLAFLRALGLQDLIRKTFRMLGAAEEGLKL